MNLGGELRYKKCASFTSSDGAPTPVGFPVSGHEPPMSLDFIRERYSPEARPFIIRAALRSALLIWTRMILPRDLIWSYVVFLNLPLKMKLAVPPPLARPVPFISIRLHRVYCPFLPLPLLLTPLLILLPCVICVESLVMFGVIAHLFILIEVVILKMLWLPG